MKKSNKFILLPDFLLDEILSENKPFWWHTVICYVIRKAFFEDGYTYKQGQVVLSYNDIFEALKLKNVLKTGKNLRYAFDFFRHTDRTWIATEHHTRGILITVCNYKELYLAKNPTPHTHHTPTTHPPHFHKEYNNNYNNNTKEEKVSSSSSKAKKIIHEIGSHQDILTDEFSKIIESTDLGKMKGVPWKRKKNSDQKNAEIKDSFTKVWMFYHTGEAKVSLREILEALKWGWLESGQTWWMVLNATNLKKRLPEMILKSKSVIKMDSYQNKKSSTNEFNESAEYYKSQQEL